MNRNESDLLDVASFAPRLADRQQARRELERLYGGSQIANTTPRTRGLMVTRRDWYERYRPDGSLEERGGSVTTVHSYETF